MTVFHTIADLQGWRSGRSAPVVLVPTMGALHEGHLELMRLARRIGGPSSSVVVSIFVNPLQFGPGEDFSKYPREPDADAAKCRSVGVDAVFMPDAGEMYAPDRSVAVFETCLSKVLCGASRPGHFDGVCTVVLKLFHLVQPHSAVFGRKDYQQLAIIRRMVRDLNVPVEIVGGDTVREADGLAMSSRNRYLNEEERRQAPAIREAMLRVRRLWRDGARDAEALRAEFIAHLANAAPLHRLDYIACVDRDTLKPLLEVGSNAVLAAAVFFGGTRLIDNLELD